MAIASDGVSDLDDGVYLVGTYLGAQAARSFERGGTGEKVAVKPRLGVQVDGEEFSVVCKDEDQQKSAMKGLMKGDRVTLHVEARAPFGSPRGVPVQFTLPGVVESRGGDWK